MSVAAAADCDGRLLGLAQLLAGVGVLEGVLHSAAELRELGDERAAALDRRLEVRGEAGERGDDSARPAVVRQARERAA